MKTNSEEMDAIGFDKEYTVDQLLPVSLLNGILMHVQKFEAIQAAVLFPDGSIFRGTEALPLHEFKFIQTVLKKDQIEKAKAYRFENDRMMLIFPVSHEFETLGYFLLYRTGPEGPADAAFISLGQLVSHTLDRLMHYNYRHLLTSTLHGQVMEDSFEQLKEKAALLEASEKKYRLLAENLEKEVERKTRQIKETQFQLMHQEKMASIGQLAAGVAHEINNPTGFVSSNLNTLSRYQQSIKDLVVQYRRLLKALETPEEKIHLPAAVTDQIHCISAHEEAADIDYILEDIANLITESMDGVVRIKNIVMDLKDFAHPGEDRMQTADINKGLESTLNVVWNELKYKADVTKDFGKLPLVNCYPQQLNQVFMNILINAVQAIEDHGKIHISTAAQDGFVTVQISDTGTGIPKENLTKIFDPFFTTKEVGKGTGLGMNVAYNIIKKHHGDIDVESTAGKGTTFTVRIPE